MADYKEKWNPPLKHRKLLAVLAVALAVSVCTVVIAYYIWQSEPVNNQFSLVQVSCETNEVYAGKEKTHITVENKSSVPVYIRVRLVSYWQTPSGSIAGRTAAAPKLDEASLGAGWVADADNDTYYYTCSVAVGASTPNLLQNGSSIRLETDAEGYIQVVEILAEAIQADPGAAVVEAWNVTLDQDRNITLPET